MIVNVIVFFMGVVCLLSRIKTLLNKQQLFKIDLLDKSKNQILEESKNQISTGQQQRRISVISLINVLMF